MDMVDTFERLRIGNSTSQIQSNLSKRVKFNGKYVGTFHLFHIFFMYFKINFSSGICPYCNDEIFIRRFIVFRTAILYSYKMDQLLYASLISVCKWSKFKI